MPSPHDIAREAARRRTFAIISHPDAGKTTLTEKFLLYSGAINQAGAVASRKAAREATSDWMDLERQRGISVTSAAARFTHSGTVMNLLDTPGHRDFSEDTYRVLSAVDAAVMVLDAAKGVEPQTLKLFEVCRRRGTPLITFINKLDRPSLDPLDLLDDIEQQIGLVATPVTWPVKHDGRFEGVVDRRDDTFHRYSPTDGSGRIDEEVTSFEPGRHDPRGEVALLEGLGLDHDDELFLAGETTPVFFGSALNDFGVRLLLDAVVDLAPAPLPRRTTDGDRHPVDGPFSGFVFKVQANMDPNHRDRIAFIRICSGRFERGMTATCARTASPYAMRYAHQLFGQERTTVDEAYPGDVIGLVNATDLRIGDTLHDGEPVAYPPPPTFAPEHFRVARPTDRSRAKQFRRGLIELNEEGVIQVLRHPEYGDQAPLLAAVGLLQFEIASWRFEHEYGAPIRLESTAYEVARRTDASGERRLRELGLADVYHRADGTPLALFTSPFRLQRVERDHADITLDTIVTL
jgi:peptide chain release factor 3